MALRELALFAGCGGGLLGSRLLGWRTVCGVELEPYRREVLLRRQRDGLLDVFPIWDDVRTFDGRAWRGAVDIVTAGFPCQPFSIAGKKRGGEDERNGWPDTIRIIREVGPRFALLENVPGLLVHEYFGEVLGGLAEAGFDAEWCVLGADDVGAPHRRKRLWILAYSDACGCAGLGGGGKERTSERGEGVAYSEREGLEERGGVGGDAGEECQAAERGCAGVADTEHSGRESQRGGHCTSDASGVRWGRSGNGSSDWWWRDPAEDPAAESFVGRVADGVANRVDRLGAIGDGQVPAVVRAAWRLLTSDVVRE
jgi:DNA (cytosine-5)-methyltransferase 1